MRLFIFLTFLASMLFANATEVLQINGNYYGKNLIVINPMTDGGYVVQSVKVNGKATSDEIRSSVFEIDFERQGIKSGSKIKVQIFYLAGKAKPKIYNPQVLEPESNFSFIACDFNKKEQIINWSIKGSPGKEDFEIEQYRWEKWVRVGIVKTSDSVSYNKYSKKVEAHSGKNLYRIKIIDSKGLIKHSPSLKYLSRTTPVSISNKKIDEKIIFSEKTMYQIYNEKGVFMQSGHSDSVDIKELEEGKYWINYDNQTKLIKIKGSR